MCMRRHDDEVGNEIRGARLRSALTPCLLFGKSNLMHHLRHSLALRIALLKNGPTQGQTQLRQFDGAAQVVGDAGDIGVCGRRLHDQGFKRRRNLKESELDDSTGSKREGVIGHDALASLFSAERARVVGRDERPRYGVAESGNQSLPHYFLHLLRSVKQATTTAQAAGFPLRTIDICLPYAYDTGISKRNCACVRPWISTRNSFASLWT